jgi:pimeloyl-[acyl-carrier protein] methyl ester esterase
MMAVWRFETSKRRPHPHVLLLAGKGDAWIDWRVSAAISRAWGAAVRVHPEAGHDLLLDDPQWVGRSVAEWLLPIGSSGLISQL